MLTAIDKPVYVLATSDIDELYIKPYLKTLIFSIKIMEKKKQRFSILNKKTITNLIYNILIYNNNSNNKDSGKGDKPPSSFIDAVK